MSEQDTVKSGELDRFAGFVERQINQGFQNVDQRFEGLERRFTGVEDTLKDHGEKIAVLLDRRSNGGDRRTTSNEEVATPIEFPRNRAMLWGGGVGTGALFLWAAVKTFFWGATKP